MYQVRKTYGHERGLSACFRQPGAESHCRFLHGYPLSFTFVFESSSLDDNNWVIDFGSLKWLKEWLENTFDHKLLIAQDDPAIDDLEYLRQLDVADTLVVPAVGCEAFAKLAWDYVAGQLDEMNYRPDVYIAGVEVREHSGNMAAYWAS